MGSKGVRNGSWWCATCAPEGLCTPCRRAPQSPPAATVGHGETTAIVVKPDGAVAWINNTSQESAHYEVHALDRNGSRVLAVNSGIDHSSLAVAGSTLYWTENGTPLSTKRD